MAGTTVACAQVAPQVGDEPGNRRLARDAIREARSAGARLVVLPELMTSGYVFESVDEARSLAQPPAGPALRAWTEEAARGDAVVVGGFCELGEDGRLYNSSAVVDGTGVVAVYRKLHLWDSETLVFHPGDRAAPVLDTPVGRIGLAVCYDLEFPELTRSLALRGADILCVPANWPRPLRHEQEQPMMVTLAAATARLSRVFFALCDRCGHERGVEFEGGSAIADESGRIVAGPLRRGEAGLILADCDLERARDKSWNTRNDMFGDRRPELYELDGERRAVAPHRPG